METARGIAIEIDKDYCSKCSICHSICPYKAIAKDEKTGEVSIDLQKCQLCGICYSACPVGAIDTVYYDSENLLERVDQLQAKNRAGTLVLMCRGNSPPTCEVEEILGSNGFNTRDYVPVRLPCSGRVPTSFILGALKLGVKKVVSIQCEPGFCRFKEGTGVNTRRLALTNAVLDQLGYGKDTLTSIKYSRKAVYDTEKCVGCDKCLFICPYEAIEVQEFATPKINTDSCVGCGACSLVCPHLAIQLKGFEFENVAKMINKYAKAARQMRANGKIPTVLVFSCQWSEFSALDDPESQMLKENAVAMEIPCFKAFDPVHVIQALENGFDGVMAVVCSEQDCKLEKGRQTADRNLSVLKKVLEKKNLDNRFEFFTSSPRGVGDFNQKLKEFVNKISSLPPSVSTKSEATSVA